MHYLRYFVILIVDQNRFWYSVHFLGWLTRSVKFCVKSGAGQKYC